MSNFISQRALCALLAFLFSCIALPAIAAINPVTIENARAGSAAWQLVNPATAGQIEGYASHTSVDRGDTIDLMVSTPAALYDIDIYRMGYYGGAGARLMASFPRRHGVQQKKPCAGAAGIIECNWAPSLTLRIPATARNPAGDWPSGVYLARLSTVGTVSHDSYILFVVRDDARPATYVAQLPVTTYQAYNYWGGKSLYTGCAGHDAKWHCPDGARFANAVSFNRPYVASSNPVAAYGVGAGEFITNVQPVHEGYPISSAGFDYNLVRWMEREGYDVKYVTNLDMHEDPALLQDASAFISSGHDEYYSKPMWDHLVRARDNGINLAFFSANQVYWQVRMGDGLYGRVKANRVMYGYRAGGDPVRDNHHTTGKFRDLGRPESTLLGNQYSADPVMGDVTVTNPGHWLFAGSGATDGMLLKGLLGYEINSVSKPQSPLWQCWRCVVAAVTPYEYFSPQNTVVLAHSTFNGKPGDMTWYVARSGAQVFSTGSMHWSWGLDDFVSHGVRPDYTNAVAQRMTANVFEALGEKNLWTLASAAGGDRLQAAQRHADAKVLTAGAPLQPRGDQWRLVSSGDGAAQLVSRALGTCVDAGEANLTLAACDGRPSQKWRIVDRDGGVEIADSRGRCLHSGSRGWGRGKEARLAACGDGPGRLWRKTPL